MMWNGGDDVVLCVIGGGYGRVFNRLVEGLEVPLRAFCQKATGGSGCLRQAASNGETGNTFYHGDYKSVMEHDILQESVDLIYPALVSKEMHSAVLST